MNEEELALVAQFQEAVSDVIEEKHDERFLIRWLRARNYNLQKAEKMLRVSLEWRKRARIDSLVDSYTASEVLKRYYPVGLTGHDKQGCPIWLVPFGNIDLKGLLHSAKKSEFIKYTISVLESSFVDMAEQSKKLGTCIDQHYAIFDLENFGMKHITWKPGMDVIKTLIIIHEANYPETLKKAIIINAPTVFSIAFNILKPFINDITLKKIAIYGRDKWKEALLNDIDASELPEHWGGKKTDGSGDPRCPTLICLGGDVPQSYYMAPANHLADTEGTETVIVNKGSKKWVEKEIQEPGTILKWRFQTEEYDIGFGVFRKNGETNTEIVPIQRVNSHLVPEDGQFICTKPGIYAICFDNAYSLFRNKKTVYKIETVAAGEESATNGNYDDENNAGEDAYLYEMVVK